MAGNIPERLKRFEAALDPTFVRGGAATRELGPMNEAATVEGLSIVESRSLTGRQIDEIIKAKLYDLLGTKWLMNEQECWYRPARPASATSGKQKTQPEEVDPDMDIAMLMVDNRPPVAYEVPGTTLRSPDGWGDKRMAITPDWQPTSKSIGPFQMVLMINHIYSQLHGYRFYLENPCPATTTGVSNETWGMSIPESMKANTRWWPLSKNLGKYMASDTVCPYLSASHRLGPFPPRGPPWIKLAALRYLLRRHSYVLYLDSDAFISEVWQPMEPLLEILGLKGGTKWVAAAEEFPPQKLRRDYRAGLANSGLLLMTGAPVAGAQVLRVMEDWIWAYNSNPTWFFKWPFEQNALTQIFFREYPDRYTLLKPGCPINSPFGAFIRHMVGGTPHRAVYHPDHRPPWMIQALQCTARVTSANFSGTGLERCAPNEPSLQLEAGGCDEIDQEKNKRPTDPRIISRLRAADWESCCAFCQVEPACLGYTYAWTWPAPLMNCMLFASSSGLEKHTGFATAFKRKGPSRTVKALLVPRPLYPKAIPIQYRGSSMAFNEAAEDDSDAEDGYGSRAAAFKTD